MNRFICKISAKEKQLVAPFISNLAWQLLPGNFVEARQNPHFHYHLLQAVHSKFQPDFIFPLMNISLEAIALGKSAEYFPEAAPRVKSEIWEQTEIFSGKKANFWQNRQLGNYLKTLELLANELPQKTIKCAYLVGPFTLTCLLNGFARTKSQLQNQPEKIRQYILACSTLNSQLAQKISELQLDAIVVLEPAASLLTKQEFRNFLQLPLATLAAEYSDLQLGSILHICGDTTALFSELAQTNFHAISLDAAEAGVNLAEAAANLDSTQYIWGNLDPRGKIYHAKPAEFREEILELQNQLQAYPNFILGTGCDLKSDTPAENVSLLLDFAK